MERALRARLGGARLALGEKEGLARDVISRTQCDAIAEIVSRDPGMPSISAEARASLVLLATSGKWLDRDLEKILKMLQPPDLTGSARRPMQHFAPMILEYFSAEEWESLVSGSSRNQKAELLFRRCADLGGRNLTEPSLKFLNSLLTFFTTGGEQASLWRKKADLAAVKTEFKRVARHLAAPNIYLVTLPCLAEFQSAYPDWYASIFSSPPVPCPIDLGKVMAIDNSYGCRGALPMFSEAGPSAGAGDPMAMFQLLAQAFTQGQFNFPRHHPTPLRLGEQASGGAPRSIAALANALPHASAFSQRTLDSPTPSFTTAASFSESLNSNEDMLGDGDTRRGPDVGVPESPTQGGTRRLSDVGVHASPTQATRRYSDVDPDVIACNSPGLATGSSAETMPRKALEDGQLNALEDGASRLECDVRETHASTVVARGASASAILGDFLEMKSEKEKQKKDGPARSAASATNSPPAGRKPNSDVAPIADQVATTKKASKKPRAAVRTRKSQKSTPAKKKPAQPETPIKAGAEKKRQGPRLDHERSRSQFLVRMGDGKSKAFKYDTHGESSQEDARGLAEACLGEILGRTIE